MTKSNIKKAPRQLGGTTGGTIETFCAESMPDHIEVCGWQMLDRQKAAFFLGIGLRLLDQLTSCDALPSIKIGRRRLYREDHLIAWLDAGAPQKPGSAARVLRDLRRGGAA